MNFVNPTSSSDRPAEISPELREVIEAIIFEVEGGELMPDLAVRRIMALIKRSKLHH
jgi:hypothetical protein